MKSVPIKISVLFIVYMASLFSLFAQDEDTPSENFFEEFQNAASAEDRFNYFFNTPNPYTENSAYDWLEVVNLYLNHSVKTNDTTAITHYNLLKSQIQFDLGNFDKSIALSKEIYLKKSELELPSKNILLELMDKAYAGLELFDKQIEIRKEKKRLGINTNIAFYDIYSNLGLHEEAMEDYFENEKKNVDEQNYFGQAIFWNNVGSYLRLDKEYPTALSNYNKASAFMKLFQSDILIEKSELEELDGKIIAAVIEGNIGKSYLKLKNPERAIPFLERSIDSLTTYNAGKYSAELIENKLDIAECYLKLGGLDDLEKATDYLIGAQRPRKIENVIKGNRLTASYYALTNNHKAASDYHKKNERIYDSISDSKARLYQKQLSAVIGADKANTERMMEEQREAIKQSKIELDEKDKNISYIFIFLVFALLGITGLVYAYMRSIKSQRLIAEQKRIIENSLVEKDSLLKEIHHRVKNNLQMVSSLLSLQTKNTRSKAAIEALEEGKSRVKAMALIHQKLYQNDDLSVIEMQGYIESLINSVQSVYKKGGHSISITIDAEGVELDIDRAIPFGLILNELVSNSFKYAFPENDEHGKIYIHLRKINGQDGFFEYTDNGVGLPEDTKERTNSSMGIRLMNRLANQLQSKLNIDNTTEGVRFWFNFK